MLHLKSNVVINKNEASMNFAILSFAGKTILSLEIAVLSIITALEQIKAGDKAMLGYRVNFDFKGHSKEREIVYQYYHKQGKAESLRKEEIGIDLYDVDEDGTKEILCYIENPDWCDTKGCDFSVFTKTK